jgi:multidrug efflux pump subunit AcrB
MISIRWDPSSLVALYFLGETLNTTTLGGLALAVGILSTI